MMSEAVSWNLKLSLKAGKLDAFKALAQEMSEATEANEPSALLYEWFISEDGKQCHIIEHYTDSAAVVTHMSTFGEQFAERFLECVDPVSLSVYGSPTDEVRAILDGLGAVYLDGFAGFSR